MYEIHRRPGAYRINLSKREREYVQDLLWRAAGTLEDNLLTCGSSEAEQLQREKRIISNILNKVDESRYGSGHDDDE